MAYLMADKLMFLHVPRTAGTWVAKALPKAGVKITGKIGLTHDVVPQQKGRTSFTLVRHPANWLKSLWMHFSTAGTRITGSPVLEIAAFHEKGAPFDAFIARILDERATIVSDVFEQYLRVVHTAVRTEDLPESLISLLEDAGIAHKPHVLENWHRENVTDHGLRERTRYGKGQRERLLEAERDFCKTWGYR